MGNNIAKESQQKESVPFFKRNDDDSYAQIKDDIEKNCKCSLKTRLIGFVVCCAIGWLLSILSVISFFVNHETTQFAILFSIGQILNITGSCFLAGPLSQTKAMAHKSRFLFSFLYIASTIATVALGVFLPTELSFVVVISLIVQVVSYFLYTLSFIPFGRKILAKVLKLTFQ